MSAKVVSRLRTPGLVAAIAIVLAATSTMAAGDKPAPTKDEVSVATIIGGPVDTTVAWEQVTIPLNSQPTFSFTQRAGEVVELVTRVTANPNLPDPNGSGFCDMSAFVYDLGTNVGTGADFSTNKGEYGEGGEAVTGLPAPTADRTVTLAAFAYEAGDLCDQDVWSDDGLSLIDSGPDTWTVSVTVSIVTLRN